MNIVLYSSPFSKLAVKMVMDTLHVFKDILGMKKALQYSSATYVDKDPYLK